MGLYLEPPLGGRIQSKRDWLSQHGELLKSVDLTSFQKAKAEGFHYVFWQTALWGDNAAIAFNTTELSRLARSAVFAEVYKVPTQSLRAAGARLP